MCLGLQIAYKHVYNISVMADKHLEEYTDGTKPFNWTSFSFPWLKANQEKL